MQRIAAGRPGGGDDSLDIKIGPRAAARDFVAFVGRTQMQRSGIVRRINRDRGKARLTSGARDADGDLAAIGDQKLLERHWSFRPDSGAPDQLRRDSHLALNASRTPEKASP